MKKEVKTIAGGKEEGQQMMATISLPKKHKLMGTMSISNLPEEILVEILSRLPVKYLLQFRCVSKGWRNLIDDPHFITEHFNHSPKNNPAVIFYGSSPKSLKVNYKLFKKKGMFEVTQTRGGVTPNRGEPRVSGIAFLGCCNGLVCINIFLGRSISYLCIWNPATQQLKYIIPVANRRNRRDLSYGFGFDPLHNDYKVVHIFQLNEEQKNSFFVYSLSTGNWKELGEVSYNANYSKRPVLVNGSAHWMSESKSIISFDMALEKFWELPEHDYGGKDELLYKSFVTSGEYLSVVDGYSEYLEIWAMKDYNVKQSWTKLITIRDMELIRWFAGGDLEVVEIRKNGEVMAVFDRYKMISYDSKSGGVEHMHCDSRNSWEGFVPFVESLVPIEPKRSTRVTA